MNIEIRRIYDDPRGHDGYRVLVDRLSPRGLKMTAVEFDLWLKDFAPSDASASGSPTTPPGGRITPVLLPRTGGQARLAGPAHQVRQGKEDRPALRGPRRRSTTRPAPSRNTSRKCSSPRSRAVFIRGRGPQRLPACWWHAGWPRRWLGSAGLGTRELRTLSGLSFTRA